MGWALHIVIDVATHKGIFAFHFLWPLSNDGFNGIRWEERWFLALNYAALLAVLAWLWNRSDTANKRESVVGSL